MDTAVVAIPAEHSHALAAFLTRRFPGQAEPWLVVLSGRPAIYLNIATAQPSDFEVEDWQELEARLGKGKLTLLLADVSVRNIGCAELRELIAAVLERFPGLASDDNAEHWWTAEEIRQPASFGLQPFWPHEVRSQSQSGAGDA